MEEAPKNEESLTHEQINQQLKEIWDEINQIMQQVEASHSVREVNELYEKHASLSKKAFDLVEILFNDVKKDLE